MFPCYLLNVEAIERAWHWQKQLSSCLFCSLLLVLCEFYIMYLNSNHVLFPWYLPSTLITLSLTGKKRKQYLVVEAVVCHSVSRSAPFCPHLFACNNKTKCLNHICTLEMEVRMLLLLPALLNGL